MHFVLNMVIQQFLLKRNAIWRDTNSNSITLNVTLNNSQDELGVHFDGILTVTYRTATTNNDEF